jgi:predicted dehydrogenase
MAKASEKKAFKTDKRIKMGIWGLGRGMSFFNTCASLNIDVVAGCDFNQNLRDGFLASNPGAFVTDDIEKFLAQDIDAVLVATYCPEHAADAIKCLNAGKHVLSEVTAFHTMAEGVALVEAVEKSGKVYQLAENYPYGRMNMWLQRKWKEGLFGELMYAEYEYIHETKSLAYTYGDGTPVVPGNQVHNWRSWLNGHYYNTHSLGPMMVITGLRPTRVVSLPAEVGLAGYPTPRVEGGMRGPASSLITMSNGALVRNLMGATTNDVNTQRIWGTRGSADGDDWNMHVRLGATGHSPRMKVTPTWDDLGQLAEKSGHGGGDFWVMYYFARQILEGTPGPFDVYVATDCTIQGILAYKSASLGGQPQDIPNFRNKKERDAYRDDHFAQKRLDYKGGMFPKGSDEPIALGFAKCMKSLIHLTAAYRAYRDWSRILPETQEPERTQALGEKLLVCAEDLIAAQKQALEIVAKYPTSNGARALREMLELGDAPVVTAPGFVKQLKSDFAKLKKQVAKQMDLRGAPKAGDKWTTPFFVHAKVSKIFPKGKGGLKEAKVVKPSQKAGWLPGLYEPQAPAFVNVYRMHGGADGIAYCAFTVNAVQAGTYDLLLGHDGGIKAWVNGKEVHLNPERKNPARTDRAKVGVTLKKGANEVIVALDTDKGAGWGIYVRMAIPKVDRKDGVIKALPMEA